MIFKPAQCPNCGGQLQVPTDRSSVKCMYCGDTIEIEQGVGQTATRDLSNWIALAEAAKAAGNNKEAYDYFTRVLEREPENYAAWLGKGENAGLLSTLANSRLSEMIFDAQQAVKFAPEPKAEFAASAAATINVVAVGYYNVARQALDQYVALPNSWAEYLVQCGEVLGVYEAASGLDPTNPKYIRNAISICYDNMSGRSYTDPYDTSSGSPTSKAWQLSKEYYQIMQQKLDEYVAKMRSIDPTFAAPVVNVAKPAACFIATASLGSTHHPVLRVLRIFRNDVLLQFNAGRRFVHSYSEWGPRAANFVKKHPTGRILCYFAIVLPIYLIARVLIEIKQILGGNRS